MLVSTQIDEKLEGGNKEAIIQKEKANRRLIRRNP
jgi:hypothetical protein